MPRGSIGFTCRHDITPRSACKACRNEDDRMRRASQRSQPTPKPKCLSAKERHARLVEENIRILAELDQETLKNKLLDT